MRERRRETKMSNVLPSEPDGQTILEHSNHSTENIQTQEWETRVRTWLSTLPKRRNVSTDEMDGWIDSNLSSIPDELKSHPRSQLYGRIISFHKLIRRAIQASDVTEDDLPKRPFQRTEQWAPVYSWLESLDADEVVKAKKINEWLSQNPRVKERLFATHSSYQLMHYIRKCHARILRKRKKLHKVTPVSKHPTTISPMNDLNTGAIPVAVLPTTITPVKDLNTVVISAAVPLDKGNFSSNLPKDNDFALSKKNEAFLRYEILTDLRNQLTSILSRHEQVNGPKGSASTSLHIQRSSA